MPVHKSQTDNPNVIVKSTPSLLHGKSEKGLFASAKIKKDEIVAVFDGPIYDIDFEDWTDELVEHCIQFEKTKWRYSTGIARLSNHSCNPNCGIKNLFEIVTMRDITPGEELTWDYEMSEENVTGWSMKCKCGEKKCRKKISKYSNMPLEIREKYKGYISKWLLKTTDKK